MRLLNFIGHAVLTSFCQAYFFWYGGCVFELLQLATALLSGWIFFSGAVEGAQFDVELQKIAVRRGNFWDGLQITVAVYDWRKTVTDVFIANLVVGSSIGALWCAFLAK